jgi:hypothetical protein
MLDEVILLLLAPGFYSIDGFKGKKLLLQTLKEDYNIKKLFYLLYVY